MRRITACLVFVWSIVLTYSAVLGQNLVSLKGSIVNDQQEPVIGAVLTISGSSSYNTVTNIQGYFVFEDIIPGNYLLKASAIGYQPYQKAISIQAGSNQWSIQLITDTLQAVDVEVKSEIQSLRESPMNISVIDMKPLQNRNLDLQQALNRVGGIRVREEGGLGSGFNLTINGIGGRGVRYFIDGMPIENFGRSLQINNLPINLVERIEIYKGAVPIELGTDALGGGINIVTKQYQTNYLDASYSVGSFNTHKSAISARYTNDSTGLTFGINGYYNYSDNNYEVEGPQIFIREQGQRLPIKTRRFHDKYLAYLGQIEGGFLHKPWADRLLVSATYSGFNDQIQTGVTMEEVFGNVREEERNQLLTLRYEKQFASKLSLNFFAVYNVLGQSFIDTTARSYEWDGSFRQLVSPRDTEGEANIFKTKASFRNRTFLGRFNVAYCLDNHQKVIFNALSSTTERRGEDPVRFPAGTQDFYKAPATLTKAITGLSYRLNLLEQKLETDIFVKYFYYASLAVPDYEGLGRLENYQENDHGLGAAIRYNFHPAWNLKVSFERTLRLPAEDELFGDGFLTLPPNDELLVPEKSRNLNIGLQFMSTSTKIHHLTVHLNGFYRQVEDQIVRVIYDARRYVNRNVRKLRGIGAELELQYRFKNWLNITNITTFQDLRDNQKFADNDNLRTVVRTNYKAILPNTPRFFSFTEVGFTLQNVFGKGNNISWYYNLNYVREFFLTWSMAGSQRKEFKNIIPTQWNHGAGISYSLQEGRYNVSFEVINFADNLLYDNFALLKPRRAFSLKLRYFLQ